MKKLIFLLLVAGIFQSCCCPFNCCQKPTPEEPVVADTQNSNEEQSAPQEVKVFDVPVMLSNLSPIMGIGKSGIGGKDAGESWEDPVGGMIGIETKFIEFDEYSSIRSGINFTFQGAAYTETYSEYDEYGYSDYGSEEFSGKVTLLYLNVPVLYQYRGDCGMYGEVGLQPGFLLSSKDKFDGGSYDYKDYH